MTEPNAPSVVIVSQSALRAEMVFTDWIVQHHMEYRYEDSAQIQTGPDIIRTARLAVWRTKQVGPPVLVLEVCESPESWRAQFSRMIEYLRLGVEVVVILDTRSGSASVYYPRTRPEIFQKNQTLTIPNVLPEFEVPVARFFEE